MAIDLEKIKAKLEDKRAELQTNIGELLQESVPSADALAAEGEAQVLEDVAADMSGKERGYSVFANDLLLLTEVQQALKRIAEGTYGRCTMCGQPIAEKRLEALPWAALCIKDQKQLEMTQYSYAS
jgi:DnaK suppressor protein